MIHLGGSIFLQILVELNLNLSVNRWQGVILARGQGVILANININISILGTQGLCIEIQE